MAFVKGKSGNPKGRPKKGNTFKDKFFKVMSEKQLLIYYSNSIQDGNATILKDVMDRIYGRVKEVHQLEGNEQRPVRIIVNGK